MQKSSKIAIIITLLATALALVFSLFVIHSLNKKNREIFLSRYFDFESISEISQKIGLSTNAVSIKLLRMRNKLIYKLQKAGVSL